METFTHNGATVSLTVWLEVRDELEDGLSAISMISARALSDRLDVLTITQAAATVRRKQFFDISMYPYTKLIGLHSNYLTVCLLRMCVQSHHRTMGF